MQCKKCGYALENDWKFCPVCSHPVKKNNYLFQIIGIIALCIVLLPISIMLVNKNVSGELRTKYYLENKYNEKFDNITLIQSIKNSDQILSCDGSNFGTIKGKGNTEYYLAYSKENDLEFAVFYDTHTKEYNDFYEHSLNLRKCNLQLYEKATNIFDPYVTKILFSPNTHDRNIDLVQIDSMQDLNAILSKVIEGYLETHKGQTYTRLYVYVDRDSLEFCKEEYYDIKEMQKYLSKLVKDNSIYSHAEIAIYTLDGVRLEFSEEYEGTVYLYDRYEYGKVWGEPIENFILWDKY